MPSSTLNLPKYCRIQQNTFWIGYPQSTPELSGKGTIMKTSRYQGRSRMGFTLVELIIVIAVICILASLVLRVAGFVQYKGATARAQAEIAAMSAALENYKADKGDSPVGTVTPGTMSSDSVIVTALMPPDKDKDGNKINPPPKVYFESASKCSTPTPARPTWWIPSARPTDISTREMPTGAGRTSSTCGRGPTGMITHQHPSIHLPPTPLAAPTPLPLQAHPSHHPLSASIRVHLRLKSIPLPPPISEPIYQAGQTHSNIV